MNEKDALIELGDIVYHHLVKEMDCTEGELNIAIMEHRLSIGEVTFTDNKDGTSTMHFEAHIEEGPINAD